MTAVWRSIENTVSEVRPLELWTVASNDESVNRHAFVLDSYRKVEPIPEHLAKHVVDNLRGDSIGWVHSLRTGRSFCLDVVSLGIRPRR